MTKEEEAIKNIKEHCYFANLNPKAKKALDFAVKALEQEPCEDAISRQAVLELVNADWKYEGLKSDIENLPPVTPQQKIGHWKHTTHYARPYRVCSVCGCERIDDHSTGWNYCPNCGAKMEGENNG